MSAQNSYELMSNNGQAAKLVTREESRSGRTAAGEREVFVREIELLFLKMNKKPNIDILKEPKGFIKGIELVSLSHIHVVLYLVF